MPGPEVAVVIPTRDRETRLAFALEALAGQTLDPDRFEVIVVRPAGSGEPYAEPPDGLRLQSLESARAGTAIQRNLGWRAAKAPLVAFTDDDCRATPGWLESMLAAGAGGGIFVQGRTEPDPDELHLLHGLARTIRNEHASGWYETCNIVYERELLERLGGFDETIEFLGEDADLGARAVSQGARLRFADSAVVWHAVHWRSLPSAIADAFKRGSRPAIVARHPQLRRSLWLGLFAHPDHARLLLALAGFAAIRRAPVLTLAAALPYLRRRVDPARLTPWGIARLPAQVGARALVDLAEIVAFAASSARSRTLVL